MPVSEPLRDVHVVDIVLRVLQLEVDEFLDGLAVLIEVVNLLSAKLGQSVLHLDDGLGDVGQYHSLQGPANNKCSRVIKLINPLKTMLYITVELRLLARANAFWPTYVKG